MLARSCGAKLRALDLGKCDITDEGTDDPMDLIFHLYIQLKFNFHWNSKHSILGLKILSENCPNLRKLSVRECDISDSGIISIAYYCRALILLNITNCKNVTIEGYRYVKRLCRRCVIHHSNLAFPN